MLELIELRFKMIGRFAKEQVVYVDKLGNFVQIDGQNNNTGGSSGSGKTTIINALDYLLGINDIPATILQSREIINPDKDPIWVQGKFFDHGELITMTRTVGKFSIEGDSYGTPCTQKKAEDKLIEIMGMPAKLFRKVIHKRQKEGGFFLDLTPAEMHDFLMDCCGLSKFKKKYGIIEAKIKNLTLHATGVDNDLKTAVTSLSVTQDAILSLGLAPIKDMHEEVIAELKAKYEQSGIRFETVRQRCEEDDRKYALNCPDTTNGKHDATVRESLEKRGAEIEAQIRATLEEEKARQEKIRNEISECANRRIRIVARVDQGEAAKREAARLAAEIREIRAQRCPTCTQDWANESAVAAEKAKLAELGILKNFVLDAMNAASEIVTLDQEVNALKSTLSPITSPRLPILNEELRNITEQILQDKRKAQEMYDQQSAVMKARLDAFVAGQSELRRRSGLEMDQARGQVDVDRRVYESALQKLRAYNEAAARYEQTHNELSKKAKFWEERTVTYKTDLADTNRLLNLALEIEKAIKYYVSYSFDEALDAIGERATKIIRCIPNTSSATIQFEGTRETGKGVVKEEVNAVISTDGEIGIPIKSLSGGERNSTDLAVDLAVIDYIETKSGKGMNIFALDEPFDGLGTVEIEMVLEVLKNSNINKKLIIVDHNPEVKQMVQDRLIVIRDGLTSKVA
jgi:DNA repair exonuclease SbcCD ATPase subunit